MSKTIKRWAPCNNLARRIARMLILAHRADVIVLGGPSWVQCSEWQFLNLTIGPRMKLGHLWKTHGKKILEHQQYVSVLPEQLEKLEDALSEAS